MGLMRSFLLAASQNRWLRDHASHYKFVRRSVSRFMPGETLDDALAVCEKLQRERITATLTRAPGNQAPIGGVKVIAASGWFAARPSGTEHIYKIYAESFKDQAHLDAIVREAQAMVKRSLGR